VATTVSSMELPAGCVAGNVAQTGGNTGSVTVRLSPVT